MSDWRFSRCHEVLGSLLPGPDNHAPARNLLAGAHQYTLFRTTDTGTMNQEDSDLLPVQLVDDMSSLRLLLLSCLAVTVASGGAGAQNQVTIQDGRDDDVVRRTDAGADGTLDLQNHSLPDLLSCSIGKWQANNPAQNPFTGGWSQNGAFFRIDLVFDGVVNPPGPVGCCGGSEFDPFRYGPNPVQAYIELDVDNDPDTGGELDFPNLRYLGSIARFGGLPGDLILAARAARDAAAFDGNLATAPWVERSGEDFHLVLVNWEIVAAGIQRSNTSDWIFSTGETWIVPGHLFQRAHGYRAYSSACCRAGMAVGGYEPLVNVRFSHLPGPNHTVISLVYPLTNAASAAMRGESQVEPPDVMFTNQNSIHEALAELQASAAAAMPADRAEPQFALIAGWESKNPSAYLDPTLWRVTVLAGGSYTTPEPETPFVWSDVLPNVDVGDFNASGQANAADLPLFDAFVSERDGSAADADGLQNASIELLDFGPSFSLFDLNYDGVVDDADRELLSGAPMYPRADFDHDLDVDQSDFGHLQACRSVIGPIAPGCRSADLDRDGDIDSDDVQRFIACASRAAVPANPGCGRP